MIYLGLGSNIGNRLENIYQGYTYIGDLGTIVSRSPVYESEALRTEDDEIPQEDYLNSVIALECELEPIALLKELKAIEELVGTRSERKWGPRTLDIDILLYHDEVIETEKLKIPHPEMLKRLFVLKPLYDIADDITIPSKDISIKQVIDKMDASTIRLF